MKRVVVFLANGFEEVEALTPVDVLRRAQVDVKMVSLTEDLLVEGGHQIIVKADCSYKSIDFDNIDMIVLPGGQPGVNNLNKSDVLKEILQRHIEKGKLVGAICAAPMILGIGGYLNRHVATCYPGYENNLIGAEIGKGPVCVSLPFVTANGIGASMEFALALVGILVSIEDANLLRQKMIF